jgi:hypothetical protein
MYELTNLLEGFKLKKTENPDTPPNLLEFEFKNSLIKILNAGLHKPINIDEFKENFPEINPQISQLVIFLKNALDTLDEETLKFTIESLMNISVEKKKELTTFVGISTFFMIHNNLDQENISSKKIINLLNASSLSKQFLAGMLLLQHLKIVEEKDIWENYNFILNHDALSVESKFDILFYLYQNSKFDAEVFNKVSEPKQISESDKNKFLSTFDALKEIIANGASSKIDIKDNVLICGDEKYPLSDIDLSYILLYGLKNNILPDDLLSKVPDGLLSKDMLNQVAIKFCIDKGQYTILEKLAGEGFDFKITYPHVALQKQTPLMHFLRRLININDKEIVLRTLQTLLSKVDLDINYCSEQTALSIAVLHEQYDIAQMLIAKGANPNLPEGFSALKRVLHSEKIDKKMLNILLGKALEVEGQENCNYYDFQDNSTAELFSKYLYKLNVTDIYGREPRSPINRNGQFRIYLSKAEHERLLTESPDLKFTIFNGLVLDAAEKVRLKFMSRPYKGSIDPMLEKKDYDTYQTVNFYTPPPALQLPNNKILYRTDLESTKNAVLDIIKETEGKDILSSEQYEIKLEDQPILSDPSAGYQLSYISLKESDEQDKYLLKWQDLNPLKDIPREEGQPQGIDARFLVIESKGHLGLYGFDMNTKEYGILKLPNPDNNNKLEPVSINLERMYTDGKDDNVFFNFDGNDVKIKDAICKAKCAAGHPRHNAISKKAKDDAKLEISKKMHQIALELNKYDIHNIHCASVSDHPKDKRILATSLKDAEIMKEKIIGMLSEEAGSLYQITFEKQHCFELTSGQYNTISNRLPNDFVVRPNHGFTHAMRTAYYAALLAAYFKGYGQTNYKNFPLTESGVRLLQIAMLFSVVGRETEIGFGSEIKLNQIVGESNKEIEELTQGLKILNDQYDSSEKEKQDALLALIIKKEEKLDSLKLLIKDSVLKFKRESKDYLTYRKESAKAFAEYCKQSGFSKIYEKEFGESITFQCSEDYFNLLKSGLLEINYSDEEIKQESNKVTLPRMVYYQLLLYKMSDPEYLDKDGFSDIICQAHSLDLMRCYPKQPSKPGSFSVGSIVSDLQRGPMAQQASTVVEHALDALRVTGNRMTIDMQNNVLIDKVTPTNFSKSLPAGSSTAACLDLMSQLNFNNVAYLAKGPGYNEGVQMKDSLSLSRLGDFLPTIQSCTRLGYKDGSVYTPHMVMIVFSTAAEADLFAELLLQGNVISDSTSISKRDNRAIINELLFKQLQGILKYRLVEVPKVHNQEDNLVDEAGKLKVLSTIEKCEMLARNYNVMSQNEIDFNFKQILDPINYRPASLLSPLATNPRMAYDRLTVMDMDSNKMSHEIVGCELQFDETISDPKRFSRNKNNREKEEEAYLAPWERNLTSKVFKLYQVTEGNPEKTYWYCYAKDSAGRFRNVNTFYENSRQEMEDNADEVKAKMAIHFGYYKKLARGTREYLPLNKQIPMDERAISLFSTPEDYRLDSDNAIPVSKFEDRGKAANSIFTHKLSASLLRPDGKTVLFNPMSRPKYFPVGMLFDVNKVHLKGQKYIWMKNAYTLNRFWLGDAKRLSSKFNRDWGKNVTLNELQKALKTESEAEAEAESTIRSELLVGLSKPALQGFCVQSNDPACRLAMLSEYLKAKDEYGLDIPLYILKPTDGPKLYHEDDIRSDLLALMVASEQKNFDELLAEDKDKDAQVEILNTLLNRIEKFKFSEGLDSTLKVNEILEKMDIIGGSHREKAYIDKNWDDKAENQNKLIMREKALGHPDLVLYIYRKQNPNIIGELDQYFNEEIISSITDKINMERIELLKQVDKKIEASLINFPFMVVENENLRHEMVQQFKYFPSKILDELVVEISNNLPGSVSILPMIKDYTDIFLKKNFAHLFDVQVLFDEKYNVFQGKIADLCEHSDTWKNMIKSEVVMLEKGINDILYSESGCGLTGRARREFDEEIHTLLDSTVSDRHLEDWFNTVNTLYTDLEQLSNKIPDETAKIKATKLIDLSRSRLKSESIKPSIEPDSAQVIKSGPRR